MSAPTVDAPIVTDDPPVVHFADPPPGLPGLARAVLVALDPSGTLYELRPADDDGVRLLLAPPAFFFPDYAPVIDDDACEALDLNDAADALLFVVINPGGGPAEATANLMAPVVVNTRNQRAAQVLLVDSDHPLRAPLVTS